MSHCFLNVSTSKSTVGSETKDNIISILCCFESKLLAFPVWKEKSAVSQRVQFSELLRKYIPFHYISSYYPGWQGHRKKKKKPIEFFLFFFFSQRSCIKFKLDSIKPSYTWTFPLSDLDLNFLDQCFLNFNMHKNLLELMKIQTLIQKVSGGTWDAAFLTSSRWCLDW